MSLMYPSFLWLMIPLAILFYRDKNRKLVPVGHLTVLVLVLLALARPVITEGLQERKIEAKDIIIALDVSYSMRARDIQPTRYEFAKKTIEAFLKLNPKDNIMLIAFTSNPLLLSPPTTDHALIMLALESLNPNNIMTKGTSLKKLFAKISTLKRSENNLILMTDGGEEEHIACTGTATERYTNQPYCTSFRHSPWDDHIQRRRYLIGRP